LQLLIEPYYKNPFGYSIIVFETRSSELELIDTGDYTPAEYAGCLEELRRINRWLGDRAALEASLLREIELKDLREFSVLDVGAGSGELLRTAADFARLQNRRAKLCGLDNNRFSAAAIRAESENFGEILAVQGDALRAASRGGKFS
jgi:SAM-dependent methyltransferase